MILAQKIKTILRDYNHRPWPIPTSPWRYYQEWLDLLFLHFQVDYDLLRPLVPVELQIDQHEGSCYVSLVAFKMKNIRPRNLPAFPPSQTSMRSMYVPISIRMVKRVFILSILKQLNTYPH